MAITVTELFDKLGAAINEGHGEMEVQMCVSVGGISAEDLDINAASVYDDEVFLLEN